MKERDHLENLHVSRIIIKKINGAEIRWDDADWIYVAQDRDNWRVFVFVNIVMILRVPQNADHFLTG